PADDPAGCTPTRRLAARRCRAAAHRLGAAVTVPLSVSRGRAAVALGRAVGLVRPPDRGASGEWGHRAVAAERARCARGLLRTAPYGARHRDCLLRVAAGAHRAR